MYLTNGQFPMRTASLKFSIFPRAPAISTLMASTATTLGGNPIPAGSYPALEYEVLIIENAENSLPTPVILPELDPTNIVPYDGTQDVELTVEGIEGLKLFVKAGSMTRADGSVPSP